MKYLLVITIFLISLNAYSQDCNTATLLKKPGNWKETNTVSSGVNMTDVAKAKQTIAAINNMIKSKYKPVAVNAFVNGAYDQPQPYMPVNSYLYSIIPLEYYCDGNTPKPVGETSSHFQIGVNFFTAEIYDTAQGDRALMEGFNVLPQMPRLKDGYYYFEEKDVPIGFTLTGKSSAWLITYDGKLPWSYVTKKEFLEKRKRNLAIQMETDASGIRDVLKNNEIAKKFKETEYKNDAAKMDRFMKMEYLSTKERYEKLLSELEKKYKPAYKKIDDQLNKPAAELNEYAIVKNDPNDALSYLFTTEDDPFAKILIKPNPAYFNKKISRSVPQFFSVYVRGYVKDPIVANCISGLVNAVDFTTLKNMLGK